MRTEAKQFLYIHNFIIVIMMYIVQKHLKSIVQPLHRGLFLIERKNKILEMTLDVYQPAGQVVKGTQWR